MKEAMFYTKQDDKTVRCDLCPHQCVIACGKRGRCGMRQNKDNTLFAAGYGNLSSAHLDPIEKKPLFHFYPGSQIFSIGGWGCNFNCVFCQNWTISQQINNPKTVIQPEAIIRETLACNAIGIAYTYNEPLINIEFLIDCATLAKEKKLVNVLVTNGFVMPESTEKVLPLIDALNIDIKSMEDDFYRKQCGGRLKPVLDFTEQCVRAGKHVEITNLVIPGLNDREELFESMAIWISEKLGRSIPLHLSAYHPDYKLSAPPTPYSVLKLAHRICSSYLDYVYLGNVWGHGGEGENTFCPSCKTTLVEREGFNSRITGIVKGKCGKCGRKIDMLL